MAEAFIRNLKLLNAKERDHLMRFAYLGQSAPYKSSSLFLSSEADQHLRAHALDLGLASSAKCVFAGMDYHLDWLFAALCLASDSTAWRPGTGEAPAERMAAHHAVADVKDLYTDFRPVTGSQEDIDLLVVYDDGNRLAVLFVEAKGSAAFNRVQLARKLIRLDRILVDAGLTSQRDSWLEYRLVLAAPKRPDFTCCLTYAQGLDKVLTGRGKFDALCQALDTENHRSGIGKDLYFLPLGGFPEDVYAVERERRDPAGESNANLQEIKPGAFTHWTLKKRP